MIQERKNVIPTVAWVVAGVVFVLAFLFFSLLAVRSRAPAPVIVFLPFLIAALTATWVVLTGYVYGDAKRRGMRYVMWTWLAVLVPNGLGIMLYFIMRDPMPVFCARCGGAMGRDFAFCPRCGYGVAPACPSCQRVSQVGWTHCAYCGTKLN